MAANMKTYDFKIAGVPYKLKSSHDDLTVQELVELVNTRMNSALAITKNGSYQNAAVLTAMNIAEELILLKRNADKELAKIEDRLVSLSSELETPRA